MAATSPESHEQRYAAIERVYSERQWSEVESQGEALLVDLPDDPSDPLRQRLILLLAHTRLYGMGDVTTAKGYYRALLRHSNDPSLRQIAEQGLEDSDVVARQQERSPRGPAQAAAPWLEQLGGDVVDPVAVEVIEEPEQIEVALADPERRQVVEVQELRSAADSTGFSPEEIKELSRGLLHVKLG